MVARFIFKGETIVPISRREIWWLLPFITAAGLLDSAADTRLASSFFPFEGLPVKQGKGFQTRSILRGALATGEEVELHETTLEPGAMPHPPHRHKHSEMWLTRVGTVEITINGKSSRLGPGSAAFVASNEEHGIRNVGEVPALYFVVAVGPFDPGA
jgi:mannose-6-phosphate isomerase-like protein (cupin superfamily)